MIVLSKDLKEGFILESLSMAVAATGSAPIDITKVQLY